MFLGGETMENVQQILLTSVPKDTDTFVIYDNSINVSLQGLRKQDLDIFMVCAYKLKGKETDTIEVSYAELMKLSRFKHVSLDDFHIFLKKHETVSNISLCVSTEDEFIKTPLFEKFSANKTKRRLTLKINESFKNVFSNLTGNFTELDLAIYASLRGKYSKILYQNLCQYRQKNGKGFWSIPLADDYSEIQPIGFRTIFDIPKDLKQKYLKRDIINPAIKELAPHMKITCETILKGRKTVGYRFDFEENRQKALPKPKVRELTDKEKEEYNELVANSEQMELFNSLSSKIKAITDLDDLSVKMIVDTAESQNKGDDEVVSICHYAVQQNTNNLAAYIISLIAKGFSVPKKTVKKNNFNNFEGRKYDYDELEKQLLANNGIG